VAVWQVVSPWDESARVRARAHREMFVGDQMAVWLGLLPAFRGGWGGGVVRNGFFTVVRKVRRGLAAGH